MTIWIIYDSIRIKKNKAFADKLIKAFRLRKQYAELKIIDSIQDVTYPICDIAIMRTAQTELTLYLQNHGAYVQNDYQTSRIANDKYKTYTYLKQFNIPLAPSFLISLKDLDNLPLPFPCVIKSLDGHGGNEVFLVHCLEDIKNAFFVTNKEYLLMQKLMPTIGKDLRVYVIGEQIICAMLRTSNVDFRSNFSLGGEVTPYILNKQEIKLVKEIIKHFHFGLVGIDFVFKNNQLILNEIEDVVGCRMVYLYSNIDIVQKYVDFILNNFQLKRDSFQQ